MPKDRKQIRLVPLQPVHFSQDIPDLRLNGNLQIKKGLEAAVSTRIAGEDAVHLARMYLGMGKYSVPMNPVAWDGYAHEREQVLDRMNIPGRALLQLLVFLLLSAMPQFSA